MWGRKNTEPLSFTPLCFPAPRMTHQERGIELVLRYVERLMGHALSFLDAEVLVTLIKAVSEGGELCERENSQADSDNPGHG